jgi:hypothetical protein
MTDYDSPWKEAISLYFRDFLRFFFPPIEADIDGALLWLRGSSVHSQTRESEAKLGQISLFVPLTLWNP